MLRPGVRYAKVDGHANFPQLCETKRPKGATRQHEGNKIPLLAQSRTRVAHVGNNLAQDILG
jgi:hypothetical protein